MLNSGKIFLAAFSAYKGDGHGQIFGILYHGSGCCRSCGRSSDYHYDV